MRKDHRQNKNEEFTQAAEQSEKNQRIKQHSWRRSNSTVGRDTRQRNDDRHEEPPEVNLMEVRGEMRELSLTVKKDIVGKAPHAARKAIDEGISREEAEREWEDWKK